MGDAVTRSLEGVDLTMNDALGGDFAVAAKDFTIEAAPADWSRRWPRATFAKDYTAARKAPVNPLADTFAAHPGQTLELNAPDGMTQGLGAGWRQQ